MKPIQVRTTIIERFEAKIRQCAAEIDRLSAEIECLDLPSDGMDLLRRHDRVALIGRRDEFVTKSKTLCDMQIELQSQGLI